MRECIKCKEVKNLSCFYINKKFPNRKINQCKECQNEAARKNRIENINHYREYENRRSLDQKRIDSIEKYEKTHKRIEGRKRYEKNTEIINNRNKAVIRWQKRNPEKTNAHNSISVALKRNLIKKHPCFSCGNEDSEAHHPDYKIPLSVIWLCRKHHVQLHKEFRDYLRFEPLVN